MKKLQSINPYDGSLIGEFEQTSETTLQLKLLDLEAGFQSWRFTSFKDRARVLLSIAEKLISSKSKLAEIISLEMGKPISQSIAEIEKCAWVCKYYAEISEAALVHKIVKSDASQSFVNYQPIGIILAVMPWNYPFWQFFRVLAPNLMLGNTILLKHASNVSKCAIAIKELFSELALEGKVMDLALIESRRVKAIIENPLVKAVTLTGSEKAGAAVASVAAQVIKKSVLELGGSNAVIVMEDANLERYMNEIVMARFQNAGQSCIAGKRFLVHENILNEFLKQFTAKVKALKTGNTLEMTCELGPMASVLLAKELEVQLKASLINGNKVIVGGQRKEAFFEATVVLLEDINCPIFQEETFGPLAVIKSFSSAQEAIQLSNTSDFGLGASIFTENTILALEMQERLEEGAVFINSLVKSDPRLPFGGIKKSGYGRELGDEALKEFANIKTVYIR